VRTGHHADATVICALLGGGGHVRAAGCTVEGTLEEAKAAILAATEQAIPCIVTG
jgi:phosphoesterase RecJ-like protein